ncbi:Ion transport protein-domain-containing protein [Baffinella frigidus]|nr:Ion transport protein-domain-containing protein [Cryptophyta sp. CCMP2293]
MPEDALSPPSGSRVRIAPDTNSPMASNTPPLSMTHVHDSENGNGAANGHAAEEREEGVDWQMVLTSLQREKKRAIARKEEQYVNRSLFCLESSSSIREVCIKIVELPAFNATVLILIIVNMIFLIMSNPLCKNTGSYEALTQQDQYQRMLYSNLDCSGWEALRETINVSEDFFTIAFTLEMVVKIVARGFVLHKHAYLRDSWNTLDAVVVLASILGSLKLSSNSGIFDIVRVFRPLRMMTRIPGMQPLMSTIARSVTRLVDVPPSLPTSQPASQPASQPTQPTDQPTNRPTNQPINQPKPTD